MNGRARDETVWTVCASGDGEKYYSSAWTRSLVSGERRKLLLSPPEISDVYLCASPPLKGYIDTHSSPPLGLSLFPAVDGRPSALHALFRAVESRACDK